MTDWFRFIGLCGSAMIQGLAELSQPVALLEWILLLPIGGTLDLPVVDTTGVHDVVVVD